MSRLSHSLANAATGNRPNGINLSDNDNHANPQEWRRP